MRKQNPNDVIDDFLDLLTKSLETWNDLCSGIEGRSDLKKGVSVDSLLTAAIGWESFLTDWHIAAINRDSSAFAAYLSSRIEQSVGERWPGLGDRVSITLPKHPSLEVIRNILDPRGANISFAGEGKWRERVQAELVSPYRDRVIGLSTANHRLLEAVVGIRNCIAHRSQRATNEMNNALGNLRARDRVLQREARVTPSGTGAYLYARCGAQRRVQVYHDRLNEIAEALRT